MNFKRIPPNIWVRIRYGFKAGVKAFYITLSSVVITFVTFLTATGYIFSIFQMFLFLCGSILVGITTTLISGHLEHLPDQIIFINDDGKYFAQYCTKENFYEANELTKPFYDDEYVINETAEMWRQKNPKGFIQITNSNGLLCASFGVIAIEGSFMKQFIKGKIKDNLLTSDDVLNPIESKRSKSLYISGVVVREPKSGKGNVRACVMVSVMLHYIRKVYGLRKRRRVYALAVSKQSENLLKKSGFEIECPSKQRIDKLNLYSLDITKESLSNVNSRIGDYSSMCECFFN